MASALGSLDALFPHLPRLIVALPVSLNLLVIAVIFSLCLMVSLASAVTAHRPILTVFTATWERRVTHAHVHGFC